MAQTNLPVTQGSGFNIEYQSTGGGFNRQAVVVGDPTTDANVLKPNSDGSITAKLVTTGVSTTVNAQQLGTWNVNSTVTGSVNATVTSLPANLGAVNATITSITGTSAVTNFPNAQYVYYGNGAKTPTNVKFNITSTGVAQLVATAAGATIRVLQYFVNASAASNFNLQSHVTTTTATGTLYMAANGGMVAPFSPVGWFDTVSGEQLDTNVTATAVSGEITYITF